MPVLNVPYRTQKKVSSCGATIAKMIGRKKQNAGIEKKILDRQRQEENRFKRGIPFDFSLFDWTISPTQCRWIHHEHGAIEWTQLQSQIDQKRPVVLFLDSEGGMIGHYLLMVGYSEFHGVKRLLVFDPQDGTERCWSLETDESGEPYRNGKHAIRYSTITQKMVIRSKDASAGETYQWTATGLLEFHCDP